MSLDYHDSPLLQWNDTNLPVKIIVKMECENHPTVAGNKWWKLKYNLEAAERSGLTILTFGGPYSNHIIATAAASRELGVPSIGIIRGERVNNPVLAFAERCGMTLEFVSRTDYRLKTETDAIETMRKKFGDFYLIPEGGTNAEAIRGCEEWGNKLIDEIDFDILCLSVGTGGTMAGLTRAMPHEKSVIGFSSLKGGEFLENEVKKWLPPDTCEWRIETGYHFGGYAKTTKSLGQFIEHVRFSQRIALDPVYTSKAMFGVIDLAWKGAFRAGSTVLFLHTGGLQTQLSDL